MKEKHIKADPVSTTESAQTAFTRVPYNRIKREVMLLDLLLSVALLAFFAFSAMTRQLAGMLEFYTDNSYLQFVMFYFILSALYFVVSLPLDFYSSYIVEHDFKLSNQSILRWCSEKMKGLLLAVVIGIPVSLVFYWFISISAADWWIYFGLFYIVFSLVISVVAPVLILPLFYKSWPLDDETLLEKITVLAKKNNISVKEIKVFDLSKNTKKVNAAITGLGKTKTILLADTLVNGFSREEIYSVFAHEIGHNQKKHICKNIFISSFFVMLALFCCSWAHSLSVSALGYSSITQLASLPILAFYLYIFSLLLMPLMNSIARGFEYEADAFAVRASGAEVFISALRKIADINLSDEDAPALYEYIFFSHPSIPKRIVAAEAIR